MLIFDSSDCLIADELSMHLLTTPLMYRLLTFKASPQKTKWIGIILGSLFTIVMVTHMVMDEFLLHATTFGLGVYIIATRNLKLIPQQVPDPEVRRAVRNVALLGGGKLFCLTWRLRITTNADKGFFLLGYIVWLIDDWACYHLIDARRSVGIPVAFLLELHGWYVPFLLL